jgi:hypothetical protein
VAFLSAQNAMSLLDLARKRLWRVDVLYVRGTVQLASLAETGEILPNGRPKREWIGPPVVKDITAIQLRSPGQSLYAAMWHDHQCVFACDGPCRKITLTRLREVINGDQQLCIHRNDGAGSTPVPSRDSASSGLQGLYENERRARGL